MKLTLQLPDNLMELPNPSGKILEIIALEAVRTRNYTEAEGAAFLNLDPVAFGELHKSER